MKKKESCTICRKLLECEKEYKLGSYDDNGWEIINVHGGLDHRWGLICNECISKYPKDFVDRLFEICMAREDIKYTESELREFTDKTYIYNNIKHLKKKIRDLKDRVISNGGIV